MPLLGTFIVPHPPLIIPEVGRGKEKKIQKTIDAYNEVGQRIAELKPDIIIIASPHSIMYSDYIHISPGSGAKGDFSEFGAPGISMDVTYDKEFADKLAALAEQENIDAGTKGEKVKVLDHGTMVPLYFVNKYYKDYKLVRTSISGLSTLLHYRFGKCIGLLSEESEKNIVFIASGDLSHRLKEDGPYGYSESGVSFDHQIVDAIKQADFLRFLKFKESFCQEAAECGLRSFIIMAGALNGKSVQAELLSYEGPFGVGYGIAAFTSSVNNGSRHFDRIFEHEEKEQLKQLKAKEDPYVQLARKSLETYVKEHKRLGRPDGLDEELLNTRSGVFVSLKKDGRLRGCIGTIKPTTDCIADEIIQNAINAGLEDPRFHPIEEKELPWLVYDVDVLGDAEPVDSLDELDVLRYGVIVSYKGKRGLLLPNLEGVDSPEKQVSIALQKAGIQPDENFSMERFEVVRHL